MNGTPPPFAQYMTAATSSSYIALYSADNNASRINLFDIGSKAWTGSTPLYTSSGSLPSPTNGTSPDGSSAPLGAIIGGAVGGVVLIALVLFFVIRRRRGGYKKAGGNEAVSQTIEYYDHEMPKLTENYVVQQPEPHQLQQQQQQVPYTLPQDAYTKSLQSSHYNSHVDPNLVYATSNSQSMMTNLPVYEVQSIVGVNPHPHLQPYSYASTVASTRSSPTLFQEQASHSYEGATEGSPLTTYETVPKVRGSPQATISGTTESPDSSHLAPRNPLTAYETLLKARGSPHATITCATESSDPSQPAPRNPLTAFETLPKARGSPHATITDTAESSNFSQTAPRNSLKND